MCMCGGAHMEVQGQLVGVGSVLLQCGSRGRIQVIRLDDEHPYQLSHLIGLRNIFTLKKYSF